MFRSKETSPLTIFTSGAMALLGSPSTQTPTIRISGGVSRTLLKVSTFASRLLVMPQHQLRRGWWQHQLLHHLLRQLQHQRVLERMAVLALVVVGLDLRLVLVLGQRPPLAAGRGHATT